MYRYTFLAAMKYILSGCQNTQTSMQPFVTLSLLIKRNLQLFDRASPKQKIELLIVHLPSGCIGLLSYPGLVENLGVSQTLYTKMLVNFGIFDSEQYFQDPKLKLQENSRPMTNYLQFFVRKTLHRIEKRCMMRSFFSLRAT